MPLQLENGIIIDGQNNTIIFPVGEALILKFTFEEWIDFVSLVSDANLIFETNTLVNNYQCGACGAVNSSLEFEEPNDEDFN
jgi:hypothetical protein